MSPKSRHAPLPAAHNTYHPYGHTTPRRMAMPSSDVCFSSVSLDPALTSSHFTLTSSTNGSRHSNPVWSSSSGSVPGVDDYLPLSGYDSMGLSGNEFPMTIMPTTSDAMDISYGVTAGQTSSRHLPLDAPMLSGLDSTDMMMNEYPFMGPNPAETFLDSAYCDMGSHQTLTPPPEEYLQRFFDFPCSTGRHDSFSTMKEEPTVCENLGVPKLQAYNSATRQTVSQPRPIRPSSERTSTRSTGCDFDDSPDSPKDDSSNKVKARNDPLYNAKPDKDGLYRCPFTKRADKCTHQPTKQKCIYSKYLDSHLRPYKCKFAATNSDCEDARFSSNACLFRHERETHGMGKDGLNPYPCLFPDCERAKEGNGFPRLWNRRDHMKRMHNWEGSDSSPDCHTDPIRRRKGAPASVPMRRSDSSGYARAQQAAVAYSKDHRRTSRHAPQVSYAAPLQACNVVAYPTMDNVQFSQPQMISSRHGPQYATAYNFTTVY